MFTPLFYKADFVTRQSVPGLRFTTESLGYDVLGGCSEARVRVDGNEQTLLFGLLNYLNAPTEIYDDLGERAWWGFVYSVTVYPPGIGLTLDGMANRVRVAYSTLAVGDIQSQRGTTDWSEDADSQAKFGVHERTETINDVSATVAAQRRDIILAQRKTPLPLIELVPDTPNERYAVLVLRGYVAKFDWRSYSRALLQQKYENPSGGKVATQRVGTPDANPIWGVEEIAQPFTSLYSMYYDSVSLVLGNDGAPSTFTARLFDHPLGLLSTPIASTGAVAWADLQKYTVGGIPFTSKVYRAAGSSLWLSGLAAWEGTSRYLVTIYEIAGGMLYCRFGGAYQPRSSIGLPAANLWYRLTGTLDSTNLLSDALSSHAEYIAGVDVQNTSGVLGNAYRDGESNLSDMVREILDAGTTNYRRLHLHITADRIAQIYEERVGSVSAPDLLMMLDGQLFDARRRPIGARSPVGKWVKVIGTPLSDSLSNPPHFFFVERATYDVVTRRWELEPRGADSAFVARIA